MNGLFDDLRTAFRRQDNALIQLILINIIVFLGLLVVFATLRLTGLESIYFHYIEIHFELPSLLHKFVWRPYTLMTYAFQHAGVFHILFNMLFLYWFGMVVVEYLNSKRLVSIYILGALAGGIGFLLLYNTLIPPKSPLVGASGAVYAVMVAAATIAPDYTFYLLLFGPVRIKYIVPILVILSYVGLSGDNPGGNAAHLAGALTGYLFVIQLRKGNDLGAWIHNFMDFARGLFRKKSKIKVSHSSKKKSKVYSNAGAQNYARPEAEEEMPNQAEIDAILDKISASGYQSLTKEEKQKLFKASKS
ncbi:MAG: rhomboid family intramembrane serine protease [Microscillaceae bacterium]